MYVGGAEKRKYGHLGVWCNLSLSIPLPLSAEQLGLQRYNIIPETIVSDCMLTYSYTVL